MISRRDIPAKLLKAHDNRRMVRARLAGGHTHTTLNDVSVHIWCRNGVYLARFRYDGHQVGCTLGHNDRAAIAELRRVMVDVENGTFLPPSDPVAKLRRRQSRPVPRLTIPALVQEYLHDKRRTSGRRTANTYASRLRHVLDFVEPPRVRQHYPYALAISGDREFALDLRDFLTSRLVSPNGHANSAKRRMKPRGVRNVLEAVRDCLNWACRPDIRRLPPDFVQPITLEIVGEKPRKDPLRPVVFGLERRLRFVRMADSYQLVTLATQYIMPHRPEQHSGLLVDDVDWADKAFVFGTRFDGHDHTKSRTSFRVPFPPEWEPLVRAAVNGRAAGPLYLKRSIIEGRQEPAISVVRPGDMEREIQAALTRAAMAGPLPAGDAKDICRQTIAQAGGVTPDSLEREFRNLASLAGVDGDFRYYDLRSSIVTEMNRAGVPDHVQRYIMGHAAIDSGSLDEYRSLTLDGIRECLTRYWRFSSELVQAVLDRGRQLGLWEAGP